MKSKKGRVLSERFKHLSIKRKLTYLYLPMAIVPMVVFALLSMNLYEKSIIHRSLESMEDNNLLIANRIESILSQAESASTYLTININNIVNNDTFNGELSNDVKLYNLISNELIFAKLIHKDLDSIAFVDRDLRLYYTDLGLQNNYLMVHESEMIQQIQKTSGQNYWFDMAFRGFLTKDSETAVVTLAKKVWNINSGETIGYLFINVSEKTFSELFKDQLASFRVVNRANKVISTTDAEDLMTEFELDIEGTSGLIRIGGHKTMISKTFIDRLGWVLLSTADLDVFTADLQNLVLLTAVSLTMIIMLEISMSMVLNNLITNPIMKLKRSLEELAKGNFDFRFNMKTKDEIGLFAQSFNTMSGQIKDLLNKVEQEEQEKRTYEMALIQQQIKPHFLYNTLDIILKLSQLGQSKKAQKATRRLADYYRNSLSGGASIVSVNEELAITKDYLELQKIRYSDMFDYKMEVSEAIKSLLIPKLTLQPLVENAIYHGLKYSESEGAIWIYSIEKEGRHCLVVSDNGAGMDAEQLNALRISMESDTKVVEQDMKAHFGLRNVNHRLKLFLGEASGLKFESTVGQGTQVHINLLGGDEVD